MSFIKGAEYLIKSLQEIKSATNDFSDENLIGFGGYGKVYLGKLSIPRDQFVAVKRLDPASGQGQTEFITEIQMLLRCKDKNLIRLTGLCDENDEKILVYEHAKHGSLDKWLHGSKLSWTQRLQISIGAARGLYYLHNNVGPEHRVLHGDIKSANILLNENYEAKVSDFGLSKIGPSNDEFSSVPGKACGTKPYVDPEFVRTDIQTDKSDVYSFGVVLFEILCGKPAYRKENLRLPSLAKKFFELKTLDKIINPDVKNQIKEGSLDTFAKVAYQCLKEDRPSRPTMASILEELEKALELQVGSKVPKSIRVVAWGRQTGDRENYWSYKIQQSKDDVIYSLNFTSKSSIGVVPTSNKAGDEVMRVGTWGTTKPESPETQWSFQLPKNRYLKRIDINHGEQIISLQMFFDTEHGGSLEPSRLAGGWHGGVTHEQINLASEEDIRGIKGTFGFAMGDEPNLTVITSLSFLTNKRDNIGPYGVERGTPFEVKWDVGSFVGIYGLGGYFIDSIGVYLKATTSKTL